MKIQSIDKMVGTSKEVTIKSLDINQVSESYETELPNIDSNVLRVDLPNTYSTILGCRFSKFVILNIQNGYNLSMYPMSEHFVKLPLYYFNEYRRPKYNDFDTDVDSQFFIVSPKILQYKVDDKLKLSMIDGDGEEIERHITIELV